MVAVSEVQDPRFHPELGLMSGFCTFSLCLCLVSFKKQSCMQMCKALKYERVSECDTQGSNHPASRPESTAILTRIKPWSWISNWRFSVFIHVCVHKSIWFLSFFSSNRNAWTSTVILTCCKKLELQYNPSRLWSGDVCNSACETRVHVLDCYCICYILLLLLWTVSLVHLDLHKHSRC